MLTIPQVNAFHRQFSDNYRIVKQLNEKVIAVLDCYGTTISELEWDWLLGSWTILSVCQEENYTI